jgi:hypothetical protein
MAVDYNLANQSGAQFRAELNLILAALQSCAYGGAAPTTTTAGQIWVDASGASPVVKLRNALNTGWTPLGALAAGGFELAGTSLAGRALIAAASAAAQRTALGLGAGATAGLASQVQAQAGTDNATLMTPLRVAQAIAALVTGVSDLLAGVMAPTIAAGTVVLKHCSGGGGTELISLSKAGNGTIYALVSETMLTATRNCALRVSFEQIGSSVAVMRDGVALQQWTGIAGWPTNTLDVTLTAGQTLCLRLAATGSVTNNGNVNVGTTSIRNVRYLADQRSLIGI